MSKPDPFTDELIEEFIVFLMKMEKTGHMFVVESLKNYLKDNDIHIDRKKEGFSWKRTFNDLR